MLGVEIERQRQRPRPNHPYHVLDPRVHARCPPGLLGRTTVDSRGRTGRRRRTERVRRPSRRSMAPSAAPADSTTSAAGAVWEGRPVGLAGSRARRTPAELRREPLQGENSAWKAATVDCAASCCGRWPDLTHWASELDAEATRSGRIRRSSPDWDVRGTDGERWSGKPRGRHLRCDGRLEGRRMVAADIVDSTRERWPRGVHLGWRRPVSRPTWRPSTCSECPRKGLGQLGLGLPCRRVAVGLAYVLRSTTRTAAAVVLLLLL